MKSYTVFIFGGLILWIGTSLLIPEQYGLAEAIRVGVAMGGFVIFVVGIINFVKHIKAKKKNNKVS